MTLSESFLKEYVYTEIFEEFPFLLTETFPARVVNEKVFREFECVYQLIQKEYTSKSIFRERLIGSLFTVLLLKFKECFWSEYNTIEEGNRGSEIVKNFKRQLEKQYREMADGITNQVFRVQDYADAQHLHPNYLNNVIKNKTGKSVGTWIAEKSIAEAKSLLQNSPWSVKEIAFRLGFAQPAHFSNYFKRYVKMSPALYRKEKQAISLS